MNSAGLARQESASQALFSLVLNQPSNGGTLQHKLLAGSGMIAVSGMWLSFQMADGSDCAVSLMQFLLPSASIQGCEALRGLSLLP